ncbi:hypothetical protein Tco_0967290 [Tanacetum coccineum]
MQKNSLAFDKTKVECYNATRQGILLESVDSREIKKIGGGMHGTLEIRMGAEMEIRRTQKHCLTYGEGVDWTNHSEEDEDYALMACNSSESDTEVTSCSTKCKESYANLKKLYDAQREQLSDASIEIKAYSQGLKKVEAQLVSHQQAQLWFVTAEGMHVVPPPITGNYMPSGPDIEVDYSQFTYGPKQTQPSESESQSSEFDTFLTHSQKPKVDKKELGYGFTVRACFVCGSLNHLIKDCDFHEKRMARKTKLSKNSGQWEIRPIWNNVQRVNKQNQFVPAAVLTRTSKILLNTARASSTKNVSTARPGFNRQTVLTSTAMKVNTIKPIVNRLVLLGEKGKLLLSPQQVVIGDNNDTTGTMSPNTMVDPVLDIVTLLRSRGRLNSPNEACVPKRN